VLVICPGFFEGDAVGAAARATYHALRSYDRYDVSAAWIVNDYPDVQGVRVGNVGELMLTAQFRDADVIIYIFAIHNELHDAMLVGNGKAKQIVRFHNVTPRRFMPAHLQPIIDQSFVQMQTFRRADQIWADSPENKEELERQGLGDCDIRIIPLAVAFPAEARLADKPAGEVRLCYVGRFFESKGVRDVVLAADKLRGMTDTPFRVTLAGNLRFSDADYAQGVRDLIAERQLGEIVEFAGTVTAGELAGLFRRSHVYITGSRHEGFCVPVIEGLAAGCIPVSYAVSNLRFIANGLGRLAHTDSVASLAEAALPIIEHVGSDGGKNRMLPLDAGEMSVAAFDKAAAAYVSEFGFDTLAERLALEVYALTPDLRYHG